MNILKKMNEIFANHGENELFLAKQEASRLGLSPIGVWRGGSIIVECSGGVITAWTISTGTRLNHIWNDKFEAKTTIGGILAGKRDEVDGIVEDAEEWECDGISHHNDLLVKAWRMAQRGKTFAIKTNGGF